MIWFLYMTIVKWALYDNCEMGTEFARFPDSSPVSGLYCSLGFVHWVREATRFLFVEAEPRLPLGVG